MTISTSTSSSSGVAPEDAEGNPSFPHSQSSGRIVLDDLDAPRTKRCQVPGCTADLTQQEKAAYCCKRRLCREHMKSDSVYRTGYGKQLWRFCFQCGKLEPLSRFEGDKRTCKVRLHLRRQSAAKTSSRNSSVPKPSDSSPADKPSTEPDCTQGTELLQQQIKWQKKQQHVSWQEQGHEQQLDQQQQQQQQGSEWQLKIQETEADKHLLEQAMQLDVKAELQQALLQDVKVELYQHQHLQHQQQCAVSAVPRHDSLPAAATAAHPAAAHRNSLKRSKTFSTPPAATEKMDVALSSGGAHEQGCTATAAASAPVVGAVARAAASTPACPAVSHAAAAAASAPAGPSVNIDFEAILHELLMEEAAAAAARGPVANAVVPTASLQHQHHMLSHPATLSGLAAAATPAAMHVEPLLHNMQQQQQLSYQAPSDNMDVATAAVPGASLYSTPAAAAGVLDRDSLLQLQQAELQQAEQAMAHIAAGELQCRELFRTDALLKETQTSLTAAAAAATPSAAMPAAASALPPAAAATSMGFPLPPQAASSSSNLCVPQLGGYAAAAPAAAAPNCTQATAAAAAAASGPARISALLPMQAGGVSVTLSPAAALQAADAALHSCHNMVIPGSTSAAACGSAASVPVQHAGHGLEPVTAAAMQDSALLAQELHALSAAVSNNMQLGVPGVPGMPLQLCPPAQMSSIMEAKVQLLHQTSQQLSQLLQRLQTTIEAVQNTHHPH